jgi:hypothetical protein
MALSNIVRYNNNFRSKKDVRDISISIPTKLLGVVIHQRFFCELKLQENVSGVYHSRPNRGCSLNLPKLPFFLLN